MSDQIQCDNDDKICWCWHEKCAILVKLTMRWLTAAMQHLHCNFIEKRHWKNTNCATLTIYYSWWSTQWAVVIQHVSHYKPNWQISIRYILRAIETLVTKINRTKDYDTIPIELACLHSKGGNEDKLACLLY